MDHTKQERFRACIYAKPWFVEMALTLNKYAYILSVPGTIPAYNYLFSTASYNFPSPALARGGNAQYDEIQASKFSRLKVWLEG